MDQAELDLTEKLRTANLDWFERVSNETWDVQYDHDADILYINFGKIRNAFSMPADDPDESVYLRIDQQSHQLIGVEIIHFRKRFLARHKAMRNQFRKILEVFGDTDWRFQYGLNTAANNSLGALGSKSNRKIPAVAASIEYVFRHISKFAHEIINDTGGSR